MLKKLDVESSFSLVADYEARSTAYQCSNLYHVLEMAETRYFFLYEASDSTSALDGKTTHGRLDGLKIRLEGGNRHLLHA